MAVVKLLEGSRPRTDRRQRDSVIVMDFWRVIITTASTANRFRCMPKCNATRGISGNTRGTQPLAGTAGSRSGVGRKSDGNRRTCLLPVAMQAATGRIRREDRVKQVAGMPSWVDEA